MKMGKKVREYSSGDFIFAKVKGYPAWPARVQRQNGKKYFVYFYGTGETANLPPNMIFDYSENKEKFLNKSVKRKDFNDGVKQIEHDFANNVPLEQVIGALAAETEPTAANDSMNESAEADESADTADDTVDESAATEARVEDSDDAGTLVIDEGKAKGKKSTAKPPATPKAKEAKTPRGRPRKDEARDKEPEPEEEKKEEEVTSRSGRKIRPKRYMDEQSEEPPAPSPAAKKRRGASPAADKPEPKEKPQDKNIKAYNTVQQSELRELKEPFKSADAEKENILIAYLPSGQICGVKLFQSRPSSFKSEASRLQWDKQAASNAITLKRQLEKGQITPQSISAQLVMDLNLTEDEKKALDKDRDLELRKARLHFLKTEMKLIELDAKIKTCLSLEKADTELCLKLIDEILELELAALMLLKHPTCMETVKRMRVYVGNTPSWELSESEALSFGRQAHRIRNKADALFVTMRDLFDVPEGVSFWEYFNERVALFKSVTDNLHADKLLEMVHEPIELSQPSPHTMKAAVEAAAGAGAGEPEPGEEPDKKKKPAPAKGKKSNSTPLKQPLKRQSSRKQQLEEKEAEKPAEDIAEEPDTNKPDDADKPDAEAPKENDKTAAENDKTNESDKLNENESDDADREVEKVNENSDKNNEKESETDKAKGDCEKEKDATKAKESNSKGKGDYIESKSNDTEDKTDEKETEEKDKSSKDKKKDSDKNSDKTKDNGKSKEKSKDDKFDKKDEAKNGKEKAKAGEKRKEKIEKEKSEEKEKVEPEEPRAKRSRETKKTEPPPRSPAKRKSKS